MSDFNLLSVEDKEELRRTAESLISDAEFCEVYEDEYFEDASEELQLQAYHYLTTMISASRDDK